MSLKAKLEAVIYAAEEPVTLAQLAMLFANEAREWKAEKEAAARLAGEAPDTEVPNAEASAGQNAVLPLILEAEATPAAAEPQDEAAAQPAEVKTAAGERDASEPEGAGQETETGAGLDTGLGTEIAGEPSVEPAEAAAEGPEAAGQDPVAIEAEARRAARQRDRETRAILREILDEIIASYAADDHGVEIREIAGGYRMATKPECHDAVRIFVKSLKPALKLSLPALETLAVIAYKQPVTAPEVNEIRGVDSSGVFGSLLARKLIATAGRKQVIGRPILYKTTKEFLLRFGLKDISELPSMEEFEKMAASELEEMGAEEQENNGDQSFSAAAELDETASEDEADESGAGPGSGPISGSGAGPAPEPAAESPESQSESNPSEAAPLHAEPSAE